MATREELYDAADQLKDEGKLDEAVAQLHDLLESRSDYALAHSALAVIYGRLGEHEKAIEHGQKVCELEPGDAFSYTAMSVTCQRAFAGTGDHTYIHRAEEAMAKSHTVGGR